MVHLIWLLVVAEDIVFFTPSNDEINKVKIKGKIPIIRGIGHL